MSLRKPTIWEKIKIALGELLASIKLIVVVVTISLFCGCACIYTHKSGDIKPYGGTRIVARGIVEAFVEKPEWHGGSGGEAGMSTALAVILLPVSIIALPIEAVADTITLPYDLIKTRSNP